MTETSINVPTNRRIDLEQDRLSITTTDADLTPVYASLTTNLGLIGDNTNSISSLRTDLTSNVASITANQGSITQVATDLASNVLSITSITNSLGVINGSLTAHAGSLSAHGLSLSSHATQIGSLSSSVGLLSTGLNDLTGSVVVNGLNIGNLSQSVSLNTGSISAINGTVSSHDTILTSVTNKLNTISYTDINGTIPNSDVAEISLGADKMFYDTGTKVPLGGTIYPVDSIGRELDYQNRNFYDVVSGAYTLISMATAINTLIGDPANITSLAGIQAEQIIQNERLFDLDGPTSGRVTINENNITTLSSSVNTINNSLTAINNSVTDLETKTTNQSYTNGVTSFSGGVIVEALSFGTDPLDQTSLASIRDKTAGIARTDGVTTIEGEDLNLKTTNISYDAVANETTIAGSLINAELQGATSKVQNITATPQVTNVSGLLNADEITTDTLFFGTPPTPLSDLKGRITDINYDVVNSKTTVANTLSAGVYENLPPYPDLTALEQKTQYQSTGGDGTTTFSGNILYEVNKNLGLQLTNLNAKTEKISVNNNLTTITNGLSITTGDLEIPGSYLLKIGSFATGETGVRLRNAGGFVSLDAQGTVLALRGGASNAGTERARFDLATGNFGIAQSNPQYKLDVAGTARITSTLNAGNTTVGTLDAGVSTLATGSIITGGNGSCRLFIKADANNSGETNNPKIIFVQDGNLYEGSVGLADNDLQLRSAVSGSGGISFWIGTTDTSGSEGALNASTQVGKFTTVGFSAILLKSDGATTDTSAYFNASPKASFNGYIYAKAIVNEAERGTAPAAIVFGNGSTYGNDQISLVTNGARQLYVNSGSVTIDNGLTVASNQDKGITLGRARLGYVGFTDYAGFSHIDRASIYNYALIQGSTGITYLNASSGKNIFFRISNSTKAQLNSAEFRSLVSTKLDSYLMIGTGGDDAGATTGNLSRKNLFITTTYNGSSSSNWGWWIGAQNQNPTTTDNDLYFTVKRNGVENTSAYIQDNANNVRMNFTGQHRTFVNGVPYEETETYEGMIVVADTNEYIRMTGGIAKGLPAITTNESLPVVSLSSKAFDKKCFGVVSSAEDPETRTDKHGNFGSIFTKESGDTRVYINSVGEGAIWIVNTNGNLESGDYITTSNVAGYGMKQGDDFLRNFTVAKITMDCDFNPPMRPVQIILKDEEGNNILDQYNQIQFVDDPDGSTEPAYLTRVFEDGTIGAFVGCTYHCG